MALRLAHRGPDGHGTWADSGVALAHRRLSILDLSAAGAQPMQHGAHVLTYNGELYNFHELRKTLPGPFHSNCDTEVLLQLLARRGQALPVATGGHVRLCSLGSRPPRAFRRARSARHQTVLLSRTCRWHRLCVGVESPARAGDAGDRQERGARFSLSWLRARAEDDLSGHREASRGPLLELPGWARCASSAIGNRRARSTSRKPAAALEELDALLRVVVPAHTLSDVPVGVFLSGGIDSALTAYYLDEPRTFTSASAQARVPRRMRRVRLPSIWAPATRTCSAASADLETALTTDATSL